MEVQDYLDRIPYAGDKELTEILSIKNFLVRARAICEVSIRRITNPEVIEMLEKYVEDKRPFVASVTVGDFASAALILLGRREKAKENENVRKFVECGLNLFQDGKNLN